MSPTGLLAYVLGCMRPYTYAHEYHTYVPEERNRWEGQSDKGHGVSAKLNDTHMNENTRVKPIISYDRYMIKTIFLCRIFQYATCFWNCVSSTTASCFKSTCDSSYWIFSGQEGLWSCPSPSPIQCSCVLCYHTSRKMTAYHKRLKFSFLPVFSVSSQSFWSLSPCFWDSSSVLASLFL